MCWTEENTLNDNEKIILIADDIELNRAIIAEIFNKNYRIIEVENGRKVLDAIAVHGRAIKMVPVSYTHLDVYKRQA